MCNKWQLIQDIDYYVLPNGNWVFTEKYHLDRGFCCKSKSGCKHCPYGHIDKIKDEKVI